MFNKCVFLVLCVVLVYLGCQKEAQKPEEKITDETEVKTYTIEQFRDTESIFGHSFSQDEKSILFSSNKSGVYNAYILSVTGGEPTQLTDSRTEAIFANSFFPDDGRILYSSDKGGNEISHIFLRNEDGTTKDLTPAEKAKSNFFRWGFEKKSFYYISNKRDKRFFDLYRMDIETFSPKLVYKNEKGFDISAISRDNRYLALSKAITTNNSDMYLFDMEKGKLTHLSPHEGDVSFSPQTFSPDSKFLYYLTNLDSEFTYLKKYEIGSDKRETVETYEWDIYYTYFSWKGTYRVSGINEDARTVIKIFDTKSKQLLQLPQLPNVNITSVNISKSEAIMTFYANGSRSPNNLYLYNFKDKKFTKLTNTINPEINPEDLVEATVVRYKSFDDLQIPAILYKPLGMKEGAKLPGIVRVHGGPGGQARIGYRPSIQYLVNHGYLVIDVNNRGSSGYGKTFYKMDDKKHGTVDLDDCVWAKKYLISTGFVDPEKVAILGGSYGGYMVLAALTYRPDEFTAGIDLFGISNWVRTLNSIPPWWESFKEALYAEMGNPKTDLDKLKAKSPLFHYDKIKKPLMVLQGANDPRVLKVESDEIVKAVKEKGIPVEYLVFDDEGHGFVHKKNQIVADKAMLKFLDTHVKGVDKKGEK
jgi:dipeptidyl aminopeptidase/acylaminoacyl peptidase